MSAPSVLQDSFRLGMVRDRAREDLPNGALYNILDFLPEMLEARLRKRGGYVHASQNLTSIQASAAYVAAGIAADYTAGASVLAFDEDGRAYEIESAAATEDIGAAVVTRAPLFYNDMVIVPASDGTTAPKKITRSGGTHTIASLGGSPPAGKFGLINKDIVWLGPNSANPRRTHFSLAGQPEEWDTTNRYLDISYPVSGYATISNVVLIFSPQRTTRVRGSVPPPDSDFVVDDGVFPVGCTDNRSIAYWRNKVLFANAQGLYFTDGATHDDVTKLAGMKSWWRDVMAGRDGFATGSKYDMATWSIAGGVYDDFYFYSIMNGATLVDSGMIDLNRFAWIRLKNFDAAFFFERLFPQELFFGRRGGAFVAQTSDIFNPSGSNKADGNGTAVLPEIEFPYFMGEPGLKTLHQLFVSYDLRDAGSDDPVLTVSYIDSPEETSYTALTPTLAETSAYTRQVIQVAQSVPGFGVKIAQTNPSSDTRLYSLEAHWPPKERSR